MTEPYGQPEPFDPTAIPAPPMRARPQSMRRYLPIAGALVLAAVAFGGGFAVANAVAPKAATAPGPNGQGFGGQFFGPGASGRPRTGAGGFGGGATGTVGSVSADQMTITTAAGGQRIVLLTPTTAVTQVTSATKAISDISSGATVTVVGTTNPDGSVTATSIIIGNVNIFGGGGRPDASGAPTTAP